MVILELPFSVNNKPTTPEPPRNDQGSFRRWQTSLPIQDFSGAHRKLLSKAEEAHIMSNKQTSYLIKKYINS